MPEIASIHAMKPVLFAQHRIVQSLAVLVMPEFPQDQIDRLQADPGAIVQAADQKQWCTLTGWLEPSDLATVQCRRSGLTVQLKRKQGVAAELLPFGPNPLAAKVRYTTSPGGPQQEKVLQAVVDDGGGLLRLVLAFDNPQVYEEVLTAMTGPDCTIALEVAYSHAYQTRVKKAGPGPIFVPITDQSTPIIRDHRTKPIIRDHRGEPRVRDHRTRAVTPSPIAAPRAAMAPSLISRAEIAQIDPQLLVRAKPDFGRIVYKPALPVEQQEVLEDRLFEGKIAVNLQRPKTDASVFPDLPRQSRNGWDQHPDNKKLHFRDSARLDTFFYLPTKFKLGCYIQPGSDGASSRPPLRVELYRSETGEDRIKATLIALPCIEDSERQGLRAFLRDVLLQKLQPFVRLEPKTGLQAQFVNDFSSGSASNQQTLPSNIRFEASEVIPDDRLVLRFEMPALAYPIFSELLKRGIFGRVILSETGLQEAIEVRLQLDDIVTNSAKIEHEEPPPAPEGVAATDAKGSISVQNLLDFPVQISSLDLSLLDTGELSDMIFGAEVQQLLPSGGTLAPRAEASSKISFPVEPKALSAWDHTLVEVGQLRVQGGSVDDWINRVHRDASLQPYDFKVKLQLVVAPSIRERVQLLRLRLFKDPGKTERSRMDLTPDAASPVLSISMTLEELLTSGEGAGSFFVEYETLSQEGVFSLPQRVKVSPGDTLVLRALVEGPGSILVVEYRGPAGDVREELDRPAAEQLINRLRSEGKHWEVFLKQKPVQAGTPGQQETTPSAPDTPEPSPGVRVTIVTDLAALAFQNGSLKKVFVVLKGPQEGGPQSSFFFDASNQGNAVWQTPGLTGPPFQFEVTYLYTNNQTRGAAGTMSDLTLVLDPPALG